MRIDRAVPLWWVLLLLCFLGHHISDVSAVRKTSKPVARRLVGGVASLYGAGADQGAPYGGGRGGFGGVVPMPGRGGGGYGVGIGGGIVGGGGIAGGVGGVSGGIVGGGGFSGGVGGGYDPDVGRERGVKVVGGRKLVVDGKVESKLHGRLGRSRKGMRGKRVVYGKKIHS